VSFYAKKSGVFRQEKAEEAPDKDDRKWTGFTRPALIGYKETCFLDLHQPEEARSMLWITLDTLPLVLRAGLPDLALFSVQSREVKEACETATSHWFIQLNQLQRLRHFQKRFSPGGI